MKNYARLDADALVVEVIPAVIVVDGREVPIEERYPPSIIEQLVEYDGGEPEAGPVADTVVAVSARQIRLALLDAGHLDAVAGAIDGMAVDDRERARIEWEYGTTVKRDSRFVALLAQALGLSDSDVNALFSAASAH